MSNLAQDHRVVYGHSYMKTELLLHALQMAVWRRKPSAGLVHHCDRGAQYTAISFGKRLEEVGIVPSL
jgi:putative transposase